MSNASSTRKVYMSVVEDVISNVREAFLDEVVDEQVLQELKQLWESKLNSSRALETAEPEPPAPTQGGNLPFSLIQQQNAQTAGKVQMATLQQHIPLQLTSDGQITSAASMAFSAQGGMFQSHQIQALVGMSPGTQLAFQQTATGQYVLVSPGVTQGQLVGIPHQAIIQAQPGQVSQIQQIQGQTLPQFDGAHDPDHCISSQHRDIHSNTESSPSISSAYILGASGGDNELVDIEIEVSPKLGQRLCRDLNRQKVGGRIPQLDGKHDTSSSEGDFDDDDDNNDDDDDKEEAEDEGEEEEPLNSEDDLSEEDPSELFDTDNVVVCQFEKISRNKGKWKFNLKDGIMNLEGKDHVFQKGTGEADW
ncbi:transcription initiation factor IIA subunit 1-like isoform X2 [Dreissena polymorpha]|uniref:Transcription initiation factor IIA subunit 1 n=1 Tax=Dreissena polymorpha TaxID=45954 RepID=A0A9D4KSU9_DREPO|nr:transcription initiation factor IIA subunit 1-like isoform X2 [Dreissena polymorpha]KAH3844466.1 hypothetical protein DPMN_086724 [Dreissena polymorpha]